MIMKESRESSSAFKVINHPDKLIAYLNNGAARTENSSYVYHYTTLHSLKAIINSGTLHLGNPWNMNDRLELKKGDSLRWRKLVFSSWMTEDDESIGMWSMYAQPWENGVKISLPSKKMREWLKKVKTIHLVEKQDNNQWETVQYLDKLKDLDFLGLSAVAYSNEESSEEKNKKITWSTVSNEIITRPSEYRQLTGFIKDMAWSYEKEIRIKVETKTPKYDINISSSKRKDVRIAIDLTDDIISSMIITKSPLFDFDIHGQMPAVFSSSQVRNSLYKDRLFNIRTYCQTCEYKNFLVNARDAQVKA